MIYLLLIFSFFSTLIMPPVSSAQNNFDVYADEGQPVTPVSPTPANSEWTCKINQPCLNELHSILLNKEDNRGIYQYCKITYENNKLCCVDFNQCQESWEGSLAENLDANNLPDVSQEALDSCELDQLSPLLSFLSGIQDQYCTQAVKHCKKSCKNKLEEVKQAVRQCFSVPSHTTIDKIMKKVSTSQAPAGQENCYQEIKKVAKKYKDQSLEKASLLRNDLEAKDVIKCEEIKQAKTPRSVRDLTLNMCHNFKAERQEEKEKQKELERQRELKKQKELEEQAKKQALEKKRAEQRKKAQAQARASLQAKKPTASASKALLGAGAIATTKTKTTSPAKKRKKVTKKTPTKKPTSPKASSAKKAKSNTAPVRVSRERSQVMRSQRLESSSSPQSSFNSSTKTTGTNSLTGGELNSIQLAQANTSRKCPVSMPEIKQAVVFQSVEAPQVEPMNKQAHPPYDNYDLVWKKPAGIVVELDQANMDKKAGFNLDVFIDGDNDYIYNCFHNPLREFMIEGAEDTCHFTLSYLKTEGFLKFFPLPMNTEFLRNRTGLRITVTLYPYGYEKKPDCLKKESFNIKTTDTGRLRLIWTRIVGNRKNCSYKPSLFSRVKEFASSYEVLDRIYSMFPIRGVLSNALTYKEKNYIVGDCNNNRAVDNPYTPHTTGLLSDIDFLEQVRAIRNSNKIFAVVPGDYFLFHKLYNPNDPDKTPPAGVVIPPLWSSKEFRGILKPLNILLREDDGTNFGGSWNVAFIRSDQLNKGTVAHELAHTLGQRRELYEPWELCRHFRKDKPKQCHRNQIIPKFLHTGKENNKTFWELSDKEKYTIMDNQGDTRDQWIDRDTYQKILWTLSKLGFVIQPWQNPHKNTSSSATLNQKNLALKVIISGFYYEDKKIFINPKIRVRKTRLSTKSFYPKTENTKIPVVTFQVKENGEVIEEIKRLILKSEMELLYKDRPSIKRPFPFSHVVAIFDFRTNYKDRNLRIEVLDPWKKPMYSVPFPKKRKKKSSSS